MLRPVERYQSGYIEFHRMSALIADSEQAVAVVDMCVIAVALAIWWIQI